MVTRQNGLWSETTLGEVIDIFDKHRIPLSSRDRAKRQGQYPYFGASGIIDYIDDYIFDGRYLLIAEDGENLNSRKLPIAFFADGKFWVNNHAHIVRAKEGIADDYFIMSWLEANNISGYITGTAQPKLSQTNLKQIKLSLPPLETQRQIADILSTYDDLIENNTRRIQILEEMARTIYREWFVHFRYPGHESTPLVDSAIGPVPEGWEVRNLFEIAEVAYGYPFKSKLFTEEPVGRPVVRIRNVNSGESNTYTTEPAASRYNVENGDILVGMDGEFHMCRWARGPAYLNQRVARFRPNGGIPRHFLFMALEDPIHYFNRTITGTTVAHLSDKNLRSIDLCMPPSRVLAAAQSVLDPLFDLELNLRSRNGQLSHIRDLLLPRLISGQIGLSEAERIAAD